MTQKLPLPLTPAMLAKANAANEQKPRYQGSAEVAADWHGGQFGDDYDQAEATQAIANSHSANVEIDYDPQHQKAKANDMVPPLTVLADIGKDYGIYAGAGKRTGTIAPRQPYPSVLP
jgi:hypothetical protein